MTNSDSTSEGPEPLTECELTRSIDRARNLATLSAIARSVINRNNSKFDEVNERLWKSTNEINRVREILESIAVVVSKTYSERGDAYLLADDAALMRIRDLLIQFNPKIISDSKERKTLRLKNRMRRLRQKHSIHRHMRRKN